MLIDIVAMEGHKVWMLRSATFRFRELKAFLASTSKTPSVAGEEKHSLVARMAASIPAVWPAQC